MAEDVAAWAGQPNDASGARPRLGDLVRQNLLPILVVTTLLVGTTVFHIDRQFWPALWVLAPVAAAAAVLDARYRRIPTPVPLASAAIGMVGLGVAAATTSAGTAFLRAILAAVAVAAVYLMLWRFAGIGLGDVRLAGALALFAGWVDWSAVVAFVVLPYIVMLPVAVFRLVRRDRRHVPFGPAIVAGLYAGVALAQLG